MPPTDQTITSDQVLRALAEMDREAVKPEPQETKPSPETVAPSAEEIAAQAQEQKDRMERLTTTVWTLAVEATKETCADLDDDDIATLKAASGGNPIKFRDLAKKMQAKFSKIKEGKPVDEKAAVEAEVVKKVLSGAPAGGDAVVVPGSAPKTAADKVADAVKDPAQAGRVMSLFIDALNEGKLLKDTTVVR